MDHKITLKFTAMTKVTKLGTINWSYSLGDVRRDTHIRLFYDRYYLIRGWTYDQEVSKQTAEDSKLPIYVYEVINQ